MSLPACIIVAGPTCSGKSALALALAERCDGAVINADAMQTCRDLRIVTARPTPADEARVPHHLYGIRPAADPATAAWWAGAARQVIASVQGQGRVPILCGGTFLYLDALLHGLSAIPDPGPAARAEARALLAQRGPAALHALLSEADPATAARLRPGDSQRLARAWEVWRGTGQGLVAWHAASPPAVPLPFRVRCVLLQPDRPVLRQAIADRWAIMLAQGALAEVRTLVAQGLDPALPAMRAHGVPELRAVLTGERDLVEAGLRAIAAMHRYTKRQYTWLKHHNLAEPDQTFRIAARYDDETQLSERKMAGMTDFLLHSD